MITVGTAGWSIPRAAAEHFEGSGSHLERYARRFNGAEINSSFYRPHRPSTYARWAAAVPEHFRFAVKIPKAITHDCRLAGTGELMNRFLDDVRGLGNRLGPFLVQLPPSFGFNRNLAEGFFSELRARFDGPVALEPRHPSWFEAEPDEVLATHCIARVAADPARAAGAEQAGGWPGLAYVRLHGSPRVYWSSYPDAFLSENAERLRAIAVRGTPVWCIFDNTGSGAAIPDALRTLKLLDNPGTSSEAP